MSKDKDLQLILEKKLEEKRLNMIDRTTGVLDKTLTKVEQLQEEAGGEFNKAIDYYALKVADTILNNIRKDKELKLKENAERRDNASLFHQILKDAATGNITKEELDKLELYVKRDTPEEEQLRDKQG